MWLKTIFLISIITIFISLSCSTPKKSDRFISKKLKSLDIEAIVVFPSKLLYKHEAYNIYKQTEILQSALYKTVPFKIIPFNSIETESLNNYFDQSNLYLLLKRSNIMYKKVLIAQLVIKKTEDSTTIDIEDKKGNVTKRKNEQSIYNLELKLYSTELKNDQIKLYDSFKITPFDIDFEKDDPTYYLTEKIEQLGVKLGDILTKKFNKKRENRRWYIFNPYFIKKYRVNSKKTLDIDQNPLIFNSVLNYLFPSIDNNLRKKLIKYPHSVYVIKDYPPFKKGDIIFDLNYGVEIDKKVKVLRGGKEIEITKK